MPLEDLTGGAKFINALVATNPVGATDFLDDADDHIRGIKNVLKNSFANVTGAVTATHTELNSLAGAGMDATKMAFCNTLTENVQTAINTEKAYGVTVDKLFLDNQSRSFGTGTDYKMYFDGTNLLLDAQASITDFVIRDGATSRYLFDVSTGDFHADGDLIAFSTSVGSDPKLKENIVRVQDALGIINRLEGVTFDWIKNGEASAGVLSTDVREAFPCAVSVVEDMNGGESHDVVNYNALIGVLVEAVKALHAQVLTDKRRITALKDRMGV